MTALHCNARPEAAARHGRTTEAVLRNLSAPHTVHVQCCRTSQSRLHPDILWIGGRCPCQMSPATSPPRAAPTRKDMQGPQLATRNEQKTRPGRLPGLQPKPENGADRSQPREGRIASVLSPRRDPQMGQFMSCLRRTTPLVKASPACLCDSLVGCAQEFEGAGAAGSNRHRRQKEKKKKKRSFFISNHQPNTKPPRGLGAGIDVSDGDHLGRGARYGLRMGIDRGWVSSRKGEATAASSHVVRNPDCQIRGGGGQRAAEEGRQKIRSQGSMLPKAGRVTSRILTQSGQLGGDSPGQRNATVGTGGQQWAAVGSSGQQRATDRVSKRPSHGPWTPSQRGPLSCRDAVTVK